MNLSIIKVLEIFIYAYKVLFTRDKVGTKKFQIRYNLHIGIRRKMLEKEMEDKLEKNLNKIEFGLVLVERQKRVDTGIIDLFCKDKNDNYVIVEIKRRSETKVVTQLAKYNMALINGGLSKKRLRTILVTQELPKNVKLMCDFFNFEIKQLYKEKKIEKEIVSDHFGVPGEEELIEFLKNSDLVNFSMIARYFDIKNQTVKDLINDLIKKEKVEVKELGGNKIVLLN